MEGKNTMKSDSYAEYVDRCATERLCDIIPNSSTDHATILIGAFFKHAQNLVRIFSSRLHDDIYNDEDLLNAARNFLHKDKRHEIRILLQEINLDNFTDIKNNEFCKLCLEFPDQCKLKTVSERDRNIKSHFVIMDNHGFRFCPDKDNPSAFASFNQLTATNNLLDQFKVLFKRASIVVPA